MTSFEQPLSEMLRPQNLADLNLPDPLICRFQRMVQSGNILNALFYGKPGIGKTSAARILINELDADCFELNGSLCNGDKTTARRIESFATAISLTGKRKICFIDEADYLSKEVQASLRSIIEQVQGNARFILTANEIGKLSPAIRSRCIPIGFDVGMIDASKVMERMVDRYTCRLAELGYSPDPKRIKEIVGVYFPDLREVANRLDLEFG